MNLSALDRLESSDLRHEVARRLDEPPRPIPEPPRNRHRLTAAAVALLVFATATMAWFVIDRPTPPAPASDPWAWAPEGWTELPAPPEWRSGAGVVWTGTELWYWGGSPRGGDDAPPAADGFSFSPETRTWRLLPAAPSGGANAEAVWTGEEMLVFGLNQASSGAFAPLAFDPGTGSWRSLPGSPHQPRWGGAWAWTGTELIVVGGGDAGDPTTRQGSALDPDAGTWRTLPDLPIGLNLGDAVWTGETMVVIGSEVDRRNHASTRTSIAMSYDLGEDAWRRLPDPPVSSQTAATAFSDGRLVAFEGYSPASAEYLADEDRWRSLAHGDLEGGECYAEGVTVPGVLFTWDCGDPIAWFAETSSWVRLDPVPIPRAAREYAFGAPATAGTAVVVEQVETVRQDGAPHVGSSDAPIHLWLWRPPAVAPASSFVPGLQDAENLVGGFLSDWYPGWEVYLPTVATAEVIDRCKRGTDGVPSLDGWAFRSWNSRDPVEVSPGVYDVRIELRRDGEVAETLVFTVGPGTTADGRPDPLVIVDVRPAG